MTKQEALTLVNQHTSNKNLVKHMLAVAAAMKAYAARFNEDEEKWQVCGILHDVDYEKMGERHPSPWGKQLLEEAGVEDDVIEAIMQHGPCTAYEERKNRISKALQAVDELTGFIVACALVRGGDLDNVDLKSVKKSMKKKEFAKAINREELIKGAEELGVDFDEHVEVVLDAMKGINEDLGL
ncbi:HDIG domain-containing protein [Candidatus Dojkabacteria bacterium]|nr:HDIG domain-containing protein [Candidatus Dojkabacteria bacterium]